MIAIITGDIINSRKVNSAIWLAPLKEYFSKVVKDSKKWEIYRGDSFQLEVPVTKALEVAIGIKALIKTNSKLNVRMAIGIGVKDFTGRKITESNGTAFVNSGEGFDKLKGSTLIMKSQSNECDEFFNPVLRLLSFITDSWKPVTSETVLYALRNRHLLQKEIAGKLGKDNTTVSKALKRGAFEEIMEVINLFSGKIVQWQN